MTDAEYASLIYCFAFNTEDDGGDTYIKGVLDAIKTLNDKEQIALEHRVRFGENITQVGKALGVSTQRASMIVVSARRKLRCLSRLRNMSVARLIEDKDSQLEQANAAIGVFYDQIERLLLGKPLELSAMNMLPVRKGSITELNLSGIANRQLFRAGLHYIVSLLELENLDTLVKQKGFGEKSRIDLLAAMREWGYTEWADRMEKDGGGE